MDKIMDYIKYKQWREYNNTERKELLIRAKAGDNQALTKIWESVYGAIRNKANNWKHNSGSLDTEDLVQEAYIPFVESIQKYNLEHYENNDVGADFLTYFIKNLSRKNPRIIADKGNSVRIPLHLNEKNHKINRALVELEYEKVTDNNIDEISKVTKLSVKEIKDVLNRFDSIPQIRSEKSFQYESNDGDISEQTINDIDKIRNGLTLQEFQVIRMYLGIGTPQLTKKIITEEKNISKRTFDKVIQKAKKILEEEM